MEPCNYRTYVVLDIDDVASVTWSEVCEPSVDKCRQNDSQGKFIVSWFNANPANAGTDNEEPASIAAITKLTYLGSTHFDVTSVNQKVMSQNEWFPQIES